MTPEEYKEYIRKQDEKAHKDIVFRKLNKEYKERHGKHQVSNWRLNEIERKKLNEIEEQLQQYFTKLEQSKKTIEPETIEPETKKWNGNANRLIIAKRMKNKLGYKYEEYIYLRNNPIEGNNYKNKKIYERFKLFIKSELKKRKAIKKTQESIFLNQYDLKRCSTCHMIHPIDYFRPVARKLQNGNKEVIDQLKILNSLHPDKDTTKLVRRYENIIPSPLSRIHTCIVCKGYKVIEKECECCIEIKPAWMFEVTKHNKDGLYHVCKDCSDDYFNNLIESGKFFCFKCNKELPLDNFYKGKRKYGYNPICKTCDYEEKKEYLIQYQNDPIPFKNLKELAWIEAIRKDPNNKKLGQVRCTLNTCRKWFNPKRWEFKNRKSALSDIGKGENSFYCSDECKKNCDKYMSHPCTLITKDEQNWEDLDREVQGELRELVIERDGFACIKCGSKTNIQCHHLEGIRWNPIESADIDMCVTVCYDCHLKIHTEIEGCKYHDLQCKS